MPTKYSAQLTRAQANIKRKGQLVHYMPTLPVITPNNPDIPFQVGAVSALPRTAAELNNLAAALSARPQDVVAIPEIVDPNAPRAAVDVYMAFLDAKARGSSTQGMAAEMISRTDVVGGNKLGMLAGGQGIAVLIGDRIDRNTGDITGYPIYKVSKFKVIDVDGTAILYTIELEV